MRAKILGIQFRERAAAMAQERACLEREVGVYADIEFINALDATFDWNDPAALMASYHGVIIGGSSEFYFDGGKPETDEARQQTALFMERFQPLFRYLFDNDIPTLGICFGHQLLGAFAGAQVSCDTTQAKSCSHEVKLMVDQHDYFLFSDLPDSFMAHYGHKDTLDRVPDGAVLLMNGGEQCRVSALKYKNNIYTTQFHPELNFHDMAERIKQSPGYLPEGTVAEEIFKDDPNSNKILQNFGKFVSLQMESAVTEQVYV
ncbi:gamma-glutamyl-gamma-aminobutyrate hydrolase family protein [Candidatus Kaiserbacteria bacterium]|nr:gamma-glutamyl-gamma-aminobutyrate hydrolase family protein [Candidatus Kaiserbacteria bacterium]MCB9812353.1 gamma-glutamyl-gamma-aminobutyrate hydrolase family protein [Candidatus Nomurabacteria bacterium]